MKRDERDNTLQFKNDLIIDKNIIQKFLFKTNKLYV